MNKVNLSRFSTQNLFQIRACVISARKAKHLDVTTMFTYSHANTLLGQSERAYYLSYFIKSSIKLSKKSTQPKKYIQPNQSDLTRQIRCVRQKCSIKRDI